VQHKLHPARGTLGERDVGEIAFEDFGVVQMCEILALARNEIIGDANAMTASK
jgi:hypothetical protein